MKKIRNSKLLLKILSGIIAVILWFAITYTEDPIINQGIMGIKLSLEGENILRENGLVIVNKQDIPDISIVVRGNRSKIIASLNSVSATADVSGITKAGENQVDVKYTYLSGEVTLLKAKTTQVTLKTERIVKREIPMKINTISKEIDSVTKLIPNTTKINISGAESDVKKIAYAAVNIDTGNIKESGINEYEYRFYDTDGNVISDENIVWRSQKTAIIEAVVYETTRELPIKFVLNDEMRAEYGFNVKEAEKRQIKAGFADKIPVKYIEAVIENVQEDTTARLVLPDGLYVSPEDCAIKVSGEPVQKHLEEITVPIETINIPDGKKVKLSQDEKVITVKTAEKNISIKATADLSKIKGDGTVPIDIYSEQDVDIIGNYTVLADLETGE